MTVRSFDLSRAVREFVLVAAAGALAGFLGNAFSARRIPLVGEWRKPYGVPSAGGAHSPTHGNVEIGMEEAVRLLAGGAARLEGRSAGGRVEGESPSGVSL